MPSLVLSLAKTSTYHHSIFVCCFVINAGNFVHDRFGNRYFENLNAEEEVPGEYFRRLLLDND